MRLGISWNQITQDPCSRLRGLDFILRPWGALFRPSLQGVMQPDFYLKSTPAWTWRGRQWAWLEAGRQVSVGSGLGRSR